MTSALFSNGTYEANVTAAPPSYASNSYILPYTLSCPGQPTQDNNSEWPVWLQTQQMAQPHGSILSGSYTYGEADYSWDLQRYSQTAA